MRRAAVLACLFFVWPIFSFATTSPDLRSRIIIDGRTQDFEPDEWVLDAASVFPERNDDSRWGSDNDIHGLAVTWDLNGVYLAVPGRFAGSRLLLLIDSDCGGPDDLFNIDLLRRSIRFADFTPNVLIRAIPVYPFASTLTTRCGQPLELLDKDEIEAWLLIDGTQAGAFEAAVPWSVLGRFTPVDGAVQLPGPGTELRLIAVVTGGEATGAGDAAPDPSAALPNDSTRTVILDNAVVIPLDSNRDGLLDLYVSPREAAFTTVWPGETRASIPPVQLRLAGKVFSPEQGEVLEFRPELDPGDSIIPAFLTARVYTVTGERVRVIYEDLIRGFKPWQLPVWDEWDGRDSSGRLVPGGIYILTLSAGPARGSVTRTVKASVAVIR